MYGGNTHRVVWKGLVKCFVWSVALYRQRLRKKDESKLSVFEMWMFQENISRTERITYLRVFETVGEKRTVLLTIGQRNWMAHSRCLFILFYLMAGMDIGRQEKQRTWKIPDVTQYKN